jgi:hypothetical protein
MRNTAGAADRAVCDGNLLRPDLEERHAPATTFRARKMTRTQNQRPSRAYRAPRTPVGRATGRVADQAPSTRAQVCPEVRHKQDQWSAGRLTRQKSRPRLPASGTPFVEVGALRAEGGVVAVARVEPGVVRELVEDAGRHVVDQRGEVGRRPRLADTARKERVVGRQIRAM